MNRSARRHRSTKVPNVKLRPAPKKRDEDDENPQFSTSDHDWKAEQDAMKHYTANRIAQAAGKRKAVDYELSDEGENEDEEMEEEEQESKADDLAPLVGCVICTTGFDETKVDLHECAVALGAKVEGNLTEGTTHLIAERPGSEKYYWAIKLGMPVVKPEWLKDLRRRWQRAEPIMFDDLVEEYRLDAFQGLTMAMAGVMDVEKRKAIRQKIKGAGGSTPQTFKLDGTFTHLLCEESKSSETLQVVQKYLKKAERYLRRAADIPEDAEDSSLMRAAMKIKIVWIEWLDDCLTVNGCIDERRYQITQSRPLPAKRLELIEQIKKSTKETAQRTANSMSKSRAILSDPTAALKQSKTQDHQIPKPANRKPNVALNRLMEQLGQSSSGANVLKESTPMEETSKTEKVATTNETEPYSPPAENGEDQMKDVSVTLPLPEKLNVNNREEQQREYAPKIAETRTHHSNDNEEDDDDMVLDEASGLQSLPKEKSLSELTLRIDLRDEAKNAKITKSLQKYNLTKLLDAQDSQTADFHILPLHKVHVDSAPNLGLPVTHFFIERCLIEGRIIGTNEGFALRPSSHVFPVTDATTTFVSLTGLGSNENGPDRHQCELALNEAGIKFSSTLKRGVHTHLLVGKCAQGSTSSDAKIDRAKKWGIPIVGLDFIDEIYKKGKIPSSRPTSESSSKLVHDLSTSAMTDTSAMSEGNSTMLNETQAPDLSSILRTQNGNEGNKQTAESSNFSKRPFQRIVSANVPTKFANSPIKENDRKSEPPPESQTKMGEMDMETQVLRRSTHQMLELLNGHDQVMERNMSGSGTNTSSNRKTRRLPPSMRNRNRRTSRTPTSEDRTEEENMIDSLTVEEMLAKGREREAMLTGVQESSSMNPFAIQSNDESMRVIYDDPASRRERRKLEAMINNSKQRDELKEKNENGPNSHISTNTSPAPKKIRTTVAGVSPSIKARRQPGTANRDT
jgi:DNA replication regulator DPB11